MNKELYISVDIETTGSCPLKNSMISLGAVAFEPGPSYEQPIKVLSTFAINLEEFQVPVIEGKVVLRHEVDRNPATMDWWKGFPEAWQASTQNPRPIKEAMESFETWIKIVCDGARPVFIGSPTGFDFTFIFTYFEYFLGRSIFSHRALDLRSFTMGILGKPFFKSGKSDLPGRLKIKKGLFPHTHVAWEDALEQAHLCGKLFQELRSRDQINILLNAMKEVIPQHLSLSAFAWPQDPAEEEQKGVFSELDNPAAA
jgi:DNA polymerase III epsilon subunit-like protein